MRGFGDVWVFLFRLLFSKGRLAAPLASPPPPPLCVLAAGAAQLLEQSGKKRVFVCGGCAEALRR